VKAPAEINLAAAIARHTCLRLGVQQKIVQYDRKPHAVPVACDLPEAVVASKLSFAKLQQPAS